MARHPCGICGVSVLETDEAIQCDGSCSLWHHRECLGMTLDTYLKLSRGHEDWVCRKCPVIKQKIKEEVDTAGRAAERRRQKQPEMGKSKMECKKLDMLTGTQKCAFCLKTDLDEIKYGPIYMHKSIITHYYCLLLSSNMEQNGRDSEGILGFLTNDINKEIRRGNRLYCSFCRDSGATLGCAIAKCKVVFHLPCGMKHGTLHQFFGEFKSYCAKHRPVQRISEKILAESSKGAMCGICYEKVVPRPIHETLWAPCCQKSAFFHRDCVQQLATSAGYFFKCPLCNNTDTFQQAMREFGIYIPEQDASWECVPHAYQDLLVRHDTCDSSNCICPSGRKTNVQGTRWELILCKFCGSKGIHIGCGRLKWKCPEFECDICSSTNDDSQDGNVRNYNGNRHRLSGVGRTADIHPSVSADREGEASDSSDDSSHVTISNRRKKVAPPEYRNKTLSPSKKTTHLRTEKKSASSTIVIDDTEYNQDYESIIIDDSDSDDVEVVSETTGISGSLIKTKDGSMIPVVQINSSSGPKRPRVERDIQIIPDEIVDITIQMPGPTKKHKEETHLPIKELVYNLPPPQPQPSTSTAYSSPSSSFTPAELGTFVYVDQSSTLRPEDLPPGNWMYRSVQPVVTVPHMQVQPQLQPQMQTHQPQMQSQVPIQYFSCDANSNWGPAVMPMPNIQISVNTGQGAATISAPSTRSIPRKEIKHNCLGRRRRRRPRCDNNRLNPHVVLSPLKYRISNDGHFEIVFPRRKLFAENNLGSSSMKRKASPLPSCPMKKIKLSPKSDEHFLSKSAQKQQNKRKVSGEKKEREPHIKMEKNKNVKRKTKSMLVSNGKLSITNFFSPVKVNNHSRKPYKKSAVSVKHKQNRKEENTKKTVEKLKVCLANNTAIKKNLHSNKKNVTVKDTNSKLSITYFFSPVKANNQRRKRKKKFSDSAKDKLSQKEENKKKTVEMLKKVTSPNKTSPENKLNCKKKNVAMKDTNSKLCITNYFSPVKINNQRRKYKKRFADSAKNELSQKEENKKKAFERLKKVTSRNKTSPENKVNCKKKILTVKDTDSKLSVANSFSPVKVNNQRRKRKKKSALSAKNKQKKKEDNKKKTVDMLKKVSLPNNTLENEVNSKKESLKSMYNLEEGTDNKVNVYLGKFYEKSIHPERDKKEMCLVNVDQDNQSYILVKSMLDSLVDSVMKSNKEHHISEKNIVPDNSIKNQEGQIGNNENCDTCLKDSRNNFSSGESMIGSSKDIAQNIVSLAVSLDNEISIISDKSDTNNVENLFQDNTLISANLMDDVDVQKIANLKEDNSTSDELAKCAEPVLDLGKSVENYTPLPSNSLLNNYLSGKMQNPHAGRKMLAKKAECMARKQIFGCFPKIRVLPHKKLKLKQSSYIKKLKKIHIETNVKGMSNNEHKHKNETPFSKQVKPCKKDSKTINNRFSLINDYFVPIDKNIPETRRDSNNQDFSTDASNSHTQPEKREGSIHALSVTIENDISLNHVNKLNSPEKRPLSELQLNTLPNLC